MGGTISQLQVGSNGGTEISAGNNVLEMDFDQEKFEVVSSGGAAHTHSFGAWSATKEPTCTVLGEKQRTCSLCGYDEIEEIAVVAHNIGTAWESDENEHYNICSVGGEKANIAAHTYGDWQEIKAATHFAAGEKQRVCNVCGYAQKEAIPVVAHSFGTEWVSDESGHFRVCSCGEKADAAAHSFGSWAVKQPTTEVAGSKERACSVCGYQEVVALPATGLPKTGDAGSSYLWLALAGLCVAGAGAAVLMKKKMAQK